MVGIGAVVVATMDLAILDLMYAGGMIVPVSVVAIGIVDGAAQKRTTVLTKRVVGGLDTLAVNFLSKEIELKLVEQVFVCY